tara:strand:- start:113 stop:481 length:369 start_codon:yes stop_codon:yes gene_type:complete
MGINSTEVSYSFGQLGSMFLDGVAAASPPTGMVFVAITCLTDVTFDTTGGLLADTTNTANGLEYMGTDVAAHNEADGSETVVSGSVGLFVDVNNIFPKGVTIYGRWTEIDLASGTVVAYLGK